MVDASGAAGLRPGCWPLWQLLALLVLLMTLGITAAADHRTVLPAAAALATALAGWHWFTIGRPRTPAPRILTLVTSVVGTIGLSATLIWLDPIFQMLLFVLYIHLYVVLPVKWATGCASLLTALLVARGIVRQPALTPMWLMIGVMIIAFSIVFSLWIRSLATRQRTEGVLDERARFAREIHDTLAQGFVSVVTQLEAAEERMAHEESGGPPEAVAGHLVLAKQAARDNLVEARRLVAGLRPRWLDAGSLPDAVEEFVARWSALTGVRARAETTPPVVPLARDLEVALLRVVQEALANVARHAGAATVAIALRYESGVVRLEVSDDGTGFEPASERTGFGLTTMRERLAPFGGELVVLSVPGTGTTVRASVPVRGHA